VRLSLFEKSQGAIGVPEFKLLDFRLNPDLVCQGQELDRILLLSLSSRFSQKQKQHFGVFHIEGNQGRVVSFRTGFP
jgi:hypothetical protein